MHITVILTQYKRQNLERQLRAISRQSLRPNLVIVFQNEDHFDVASLKHLYDFQHVRSEYNTKYFGRFAYALSVPTDYVVILDDDIIPGEKCLEGYINQCVSLNGIIGGNGRIASLNQNIDRLYEPPDTGIRIEPTLVDFVGHMWVLKKEWLYAMFAIQPSTLDTGEDMHLCFSSKLLLNIPSYVGRQEASEYSSDIENNALAIDEHSSFQKTPSALRQSVEQYFLDKGCTFITTNNKSYTTRIFDPIRKFWK